MATQQGSAPSATHCDGVFPYLLLATCLAGPCEEVRTCSWLAGPLPLSLFSLIHSLTHSFIHSLTHSFIQSFTHSFSLSLSLSLSVSLSLPLPLPVPLPLRLPLPILLLLPWPFEFPAPPHSRTSRAIQVCQIIQVFKLSPYEEVLLVHTQIKHAMSVMRVLTYRFL